GLLPLRRGGGLVWGGGGRGVVSPGGGRGGGGGGPPPPPAARQADLEAQRHLAETELAAERRRLQAQADTLAQQQALCQQRWDRLRRAGRLLASQRKSLHLHRQQQQATAADLARLKAECDEARRDLTQLRQQLPELEIQAQEAADRLRQAREQLRNSLAEWHDYARQSQQDMQSMLERIQADIDSLHRREHALQVARQEHRLAVAAFRQQIIDWQGQLADMKRTLEHDGSLLERRQAELEAQARQVQATSEQLAHKAEQLDEEHRLAAQRRQEMEQHLADMRAWYRKKLRQLSQGDRVATEPGPDTPTGGPAILSLTGDIEPGDRRLGDLLRCLGLIDEDTLTALLVEARKQRRSLRQALLASGVLTVYQLALIEAGNLDGLVLGPLRVVDRLRTTARETVYRVFDPRAETENRATALLRHLAEGEMLDAVRPDEFRQRFAAMASVRHPHLAATWEVLEIAGRPAALQEWLVGLPSTDWPALAAVPGVWFRLLSQAALGMHAAHEAGLTHGQLTPDAVVLTPEGLVKLRGFGEPPWLREPLPHHHTGSTPQTDTPRSEEAADLAALGRIAEGWLAAAASRRGPRLRPVDERLQSILRRLQAPEDAYPSAAALLDDLDHLSPELPANAEAWNRLLRHVQDQANGETFWRQSA
ncbi:MAG: hypothetical protein NZ700_12460, partial [Gemmataceae bacterium]|nr:hypothetical protein [Gemmataceae bacterium]MDW8264639.1 hypothetical protein [Gemmataceae bacterium]